MTADIREIVGGRPRRYPSGRMPPESEGVAMPVHAGPERLETRRETAS
jgi:hypothetical protein